MPCTDRATLLHRAGRVMAASQRVGARLLLVPGVPRAGVQEAISAARTHGSSVHALHVRDLAVELRTRELAQATRVLEERARGLLAQYELCCLLDLERARREDAERALRGLTSRVL